MTRCAETAAVPGIVEIDQAPPQALKQIECLFDFAQDDGAAVETSGDLTVQKAG